MNNKREQIIEILNTGWKFGMDADTQQAVLENAEYLADKIIAESLQNGCKLEYIKKDE